MKIGAQQSCGGFACRGYPSVSLRRLARSRLLRHASSQDLCLRDCPATAAPTDDHLASSSQQLDRRAARGIWTAGEPIVKLLTFERPSCSPAGPARSDRPDWPAAAPSRRRPADLLPASTRAHGDDVIGLVPCLFFVEKDSNHMCHECPFSHMIV